MSTIQAKGSFKRVNRFLKEGGKLLDNTSDNKIVISYYNYLINIGNEENTISQKLRFIYLLETYLLSIDKTFKTLTRENIYDYFEECSKLSWGLSYQDSNKLGYKSFSKLDTDQTSE